MEIRTLLPSEQEEALELALAVFAEYEGPVYPPQGTASFQKSLSDPAYLGTLHRFYGAWEDGRLVGMLAIREEGRHIALFFCGRTRPSAWDWEEALFTGGGRLPGNRNDRGIFSVCGGNLPSAGLSGYRPRTEKERYPIHTHGVAPINYND